MGNSNSSHANPQTQYQEIGVSESQMLSHLIILLDKHTQEKYMLKQITFSDQKQCAQLIKDMQHRRTLNNKKMGKFIVQVKKIEWKEITDICGKSYKVMLYLQFIDKTLRKVYDARAQQKQPFSQEEIMVFLRAVVSNLIALYDNSFRNIHLYKESILVKGEEYKLIDSQLCRRVHPYLQILNCLPTKLGTYLAPELLEELRKNNTDFYPTPKADIFTLAVIVMELCTFRSFDEFYDYETKTMNSEGVRYLACNINYSEQLREILRLMLIEDEEQRIGLISLKELLTSQNSEVNSAILRSSSQTCHLKKTARTFISRSRPISVTSREDNTHKGHKLNENKEGQKTNHIIFNKYQSQYKSDCLPTDYQQKAPLHPTYKHYATNPVTIRNRISSVGAKINQNRLPLHPIQGINIEIKQTPKSTVEGNCFKAKQFETPVNVMYEQIRKQNEEDQPQTTPIHHLQYFNSNHQQNPPQQQQPQRYNFSKLKSYGQHLFANGARYEGQFNKDCQFEGNGLLYYPNGKLCYSGSWRGNSFNGFGVLHNECPTCHHQPTNYFNFNCWDKFAWERYEGQFLDDKKDGFGTLFFTNGDKFSGCFKEDLIEGFGTFYSVRDNQHINGIWVKNILNK